MKNEDKKKKKKLNVGIGAQNLLGSECTEQRMKANIKYAASGA